LITEFSLLFIVVGCWKTAEGELSARGGKERSLVQIQSSIQIKHLRENNLRRRFFVLLGLNVSPEGDFVKRNGDNTKDSTFY